MAEFELTNEVKQEIAVLCALFATKYDIPISELQEFIGNLLLLTGRFKVKVH